MATGVRQRYAMPGWAAICKVLASTATGSTGHPFALRTPTSRQRPSPGPTSETQTIQPLKRGKLSYPPLQPQRRCRLLQLLGESSSCDPGVTVDLVAKSLPARCKASSTVPSMAWLHKTDASRKLAKLFHSDNTWVLGDDPLLCIALLFYHDSFLSTSTDDMNHDIVYNIPTEISQNPLDLQHHKHMLLQVLAAAAATWLC